MKKHLLKLIVLFICGLTVVSCKKDTDLKNGDEIQLEDINLNFNNAGQSQLLEIPINEKSNGWHIYSPSQDTWLTQEIIPGRSSIYVYVDGNTSGEARSSYIVIRSKNQTLKVNVNQDNEGGVGLSQTYVPVRYLNSTSIVNITNFDELTDITVSAEEGTQGWLSIFLENEKINIHTTINDLTEARQALITVSAKRKISGETSTAFINLYQGRGGMTPYIIELPDFSESNVYKVMDGNKQVAQIAKEFLRLVGQINAQAIVIYPVENDIVSINKGYVAQIVLENKDLSDATYTYQTPTAAIHGGTVSFEIAGNKISSYVAGNEANPVTTVYMPGDVGMGPEEVPGSQTTTLEPHRIVDIRGSEQNEYPIVKIGAQYWMGKNLNTVYYNSKKNFNAIPTNKSTAEDRLAANYAVYGYQNGASTDPVSITNRLRYGLHYSFLAIGGFNTVAESGLPLTGGDLEDNLSPTGWLVPRSIDRDALQNYIGSYTRLRAFITFSDDQQITGTSRIIRSDDNITGFSAINASYRATGGGWENREANNAGRFWTRTSSSETAGRSFNVEGSANSEVLQRMLSIRSLNFNAIKLSDN